MNTGKVFMCSRVLSFKAFSPFLVGVCCWEALQILVIMELCR